MDQNEGRADWQSCSRIEKSGKAFTMWHSRIDIPVPAGALAAPFGDGCEMRQAEGMNLTLAHAWMTGTSAYIPDSYTPSYQYPLVCILHDHDRSERDLNNWFPAISEQNFLGLGVRAPFPSRSGLPGQFRWRGQRPDSSWGAISDAISDVTGEWNVHPDRIYLHGIGNGAVIALQQFILSQLGPSDADFKLAGVSCSQLPAWWPRLLPPVTTNLEGKLLFLDECRDGEECAAIDALRESGCDVSIASCQENTAPTVMNRWILSNISTVIW
jgi:hypothetical protein